MPSDDTLTKPEPKRSRGRPRLYATEAERKANNVARTRKWATANPDKVAAQRKRYNAGERKNMMQLKIHRADKRKFEELQRRCGGKSQQDTLRFMIESLLGE